jgi:two-component system OmpR family sensor kinase
MHMIRRFQFTGPPLGLQIIALLFGGLIVGQLVTLFLTLLLPPEPQPQYGLDAIGRALSGLSLTRDGSLRRTVQSGPPEPSGPGWLTSERSRHDLAQLLGRNDSDVALYFFTPLPFAGTARLPVRTAGILPPPEWREVAEHHRLPSGFVDIDYQVAQLSTGTVGLPAGGFPGSSIPGGVVPQVTAVPNISIQNIPAQIPAINGAMTPNLPSAGVTSFPIPQSGVVMPQSFVIAPAQGVIGRTITVPAIGNALPGLQAAPTIGPMLSRPNMPAPTLPIISPLINLPGHVAEPSGLAAGTNSIVPRHLLQLPRIDMSATDMKPRPIAPARSIIPNAVRDTPLPMMSAPPVMRIPAAPPVVKAPAMVPIPMTAPPRGLFGLAPAPFVEGDFVAALRMTDGGWAVVKPTPEPFPNSWQRRVILWFLISFAIVAPIGWLFARRLVRPIAGFALAAELLGRDPGGPILALEGPAEVGRAAHAFNRMQSRLRSFVDDRTAMVGAISHDLRTPLTRLRFRIEDVPDGMREGMLAEVDEMEQMISSVLAFIRDASEPGSREMLDLRGILEDVVEDAVFVGKRVVLEGTAAAKVEVDPLGIRRLLGNLIENAVKYGDSAKVRLFTSQQEAFAEIHDNGPGLPEDELERVFQPFYRAPAARASGKHGTGLGLAVCRSIARAHGGDVQLRRGDRGLVAQVRLPLAYGTAVP